MTDQELMTLAEAREVMSHAGETLRKVSAFLSTTAAAPDYRALLAAILPYAESRAEDLQQAKDAGNEDPAYPGAVEAWTAVQAASTALGGVFAPPWVIGLPHQALREIVALDDELNARELVSDFKAYNSVVAIARQALEAVPAKPTAPPPCCDAGDIIYRLIEWADFTGGWDAPIWDRARAYYLATRRG